MELQAGRFPFYNFSTQKIGRTSDKKMPGENRSTSVNRCLLCCIAWILHSPSPDLALPWRKLPSLRLYLSPGQPVSSDWSMGQYKDSTPSLDSGHLRRTSPFQRSPRDQLRALLQLPCSPTSRCLPNFCAAFVPKSTP